MVLLMDNLTVRKSAAVTEFIKSKEMIVQWFLPPYSCDLNPIERVWHQVKQKWRRMLVAKYKYFVTVEDDVTSIS